MPLFLGEGGCLVENYAFTGGPYSSVDTPWRKIVPPGAILPHALQSRNNLTVFSGLQEDLRELSQHLRCIDLGQV